MFAIRHELAATVSVILKRRIPARLLDSQAAAQAAGWVGELLHRELGVPQPDVDRQVSEFAEDVAAEKAALLG